MLFKHSEISAARIALYSLLVLCCIYISQSCARAASDDWPETQLFVDYPWLAPPAHGWLIQELDLTKGNPKTTLGAVGVGNGMVFGLMGLDMPQNAISNMIGPGYETEGAFFGNIWLDVLQRDTTTDRLKKVVFRKSRIYKVPGRQAIVTQEANDQFLFTTVTFTLPDASALLRVVALKRLPGASLGDVSVRITQLPADKAFENIPEWLQHCSVTGYAQQIDNKILCVDTEMPSLNFYESEGYGFVTFRFHDMSPPLGKDILPFYSLKNLNLLHKLKNVDALTISSASAPRIAAFMENILDLLLTQTAGESRAIGVMARYSGAWCRDAYGPIRFYTKAGKYEEARRVAEFYDYATRLKGFRNRYPVDLDLSTAPKDFDWESINPQQGDDPNILIMHIYNVWRATDDDAFIKEHYGFMRRNLMGQEIGDWHLPFHGDETYQVYIMMQEGAPMNTFYSVDTSFWYAVAAESLAEMADAIGETADAAEFRKRAQQCRDHVEKYYWDQERGYYTPYVTKDGLTPATSPFANINLRPLWMGYAQPSDPRMRQNVITTAKMLMKKSGTMKTSKRVAYYTGMTPGLLLWNLKAIGLTKRADMAFDGLFNVVMSPLGDFAEAYDGNDQWLDYTNLPNVYRPWETAINADAVLYYLTGYDYDHRANRLTLQPHLPPGVNEMAIDNLYAGPNKVKLCMKRSMERPYRMDVTVENIGTNDLEIELLTEIIKDESAPNGFKIIEYANYQRKMWREAITLKPGDIVRSPSGLKE